MKLDYEKINKFLDGAKVIWEKWMVVTIIDGRVQDWMRKKHYFYFYFF